MTMSNMVLISRVRVIEERNWKGWKVGLWWWLQLFEMVFERVVSVLVGIKFYCDDCKHVRSWLDFSIGNTT